MKPLGITKILVLLLAVFLFQPVKAVVLYGTENFPDANGTTDDPSAEWTTNCSDCNLFDGGSFDVQSNQIEGEDLDGVAIWKTQAIDISAHSFAQFSLDLDDDGNSLSADDTISVYYAVDGGSEVLIYRGISNLPTSPEPITAINIAGNSLVIIVKMYNNTIGEKYTIDNVLVEDFVPVTYYSRVDGNWNVAANWSTTGHAGSAAASFPDADNVNVEIGNGNTMTFNGTYELANLTIKNASSLQFSGNNRILDVANNGTVDIQAGGSLDRNGTSGSRLRYAQKGLYEIINNGALFDIGRINTNLEESQITISGASDIILREHFNYNDPGTEIINNSTGTLTVPLVRFKNINQKFTNNGTIVVNEFERQSGTTDGCVITNGASGTMTVNTRMDCGNHTWTINNYGTFDHNGTWFNCTAGEVLMYNYANAVYNFEGTTTSDGDVYLYANYSGNEVNYDRAGNQNVLIPQDNYTKLTLSGSGTKTPVAGTLDINDTLAIEGTAILDVSANANDITLAGNWFNNTGAAGTFTEGTQTVTLEGTGTQEIKNTDDETFYNLVINKSAGSVTIEGASDVEVSNQLTMTNGIFETGTRALDGAGNIVATGGDIRFTRTGVTVPEMTGTITCTGGTFTFNGAGAQTIKATPGAEEYHAVIFDGSGTKTLAGTIDVDSNLTIDAGVTLDVTATPYNISLEGDWNNTGSFTEQTGTVTLDGSSAMTISHSSEETFYNLTINNSAASSSVTCGSDVRVSNSLTFTDGHIVSSAANTLKLSSGASVSGASDNSHVTGLMEKDMTTATLFEFPVGSGLSYRRVGITPAGTGATTYRAEYFQSKYPVADPSTIDHISVSEYWTIERSAGSEDCAVRLSYAASSGVDNQGSLLVTNYDGSSDWDDVCGGCGTGGIVTDGWIETGTNFGFGTSKYFTLGCNNPAQNPLSSDLYSRGSSSWSDNTNWSYIDGGPSCGCTPQQTTEVYVRTGETLDIDVAANARNVQVYNGGTLRWTSGNDLTITGNGVIDVDAGGTMTANGNTGGVEFSSGGGSYSIVNDGSMDIYNLTLNNAAGTVLFSGGSGITIKDDIEVDGSGVTITNNNTGTINLDNTSGSGDFRFKDASQTLTNNGTITIGRNLSFENDNATITNNGTINITADIAMAGTTDDNNVINNAAAGTLNIDDDIDLNSSIFRINNYGNVDLEGEFLNVQAGEGTFYNYAGATWTFAGSTASDVDVQLYCDYATNTFNYDGGAAQNIYVPADAYNQLRLTNSGTKSSTGNLDINGNLSITGTAVLDVDAGNDNINIAGAWTNTSTAGDPFVQGTETVTFDGSGQQLITNGNGETFNNVVINKSDTLELNSAVSTNMRIQSGGLMTLTSGIIKSGASELLTISDNAGMIGGNANCYVVGPLAKEGDDDFIFHVGNSGKWAPVEIEGNAEAETFTVQYSTGMYSDTTTTAALTNVSIVEYWDIIDGGVVGGNDADVTMYWKDQDFSGIDDAADLVVAHFNGTDWEDYGQSTIDFDDPGWIKVNGVSSFSPFTFGSKSKSENPLPVELLSFTATLEEDKVSIDWITGSEINSDYFEIEKSRDGLNFESIGIVSAAGTSNEKLDYSSIDYDPFEGITYYRLKQVDFDGTESYSEVAAVSQASDLQVDIFPNPIQSYQNLNLRIQGEHQNEEILVVLRDAMGTEVYSKLIVFRQGELLTAIDIAKKVTPGIYIVVGSSRQELFSKRLIVK